MINLYIARGGRKEILESKSMESGGCLESIGDIGELGHRTEHLCLGLVSTPERQRCFMSFIEAALTAAREYLPNRRAGGLRLFYQLHHKYVAMLLNESKSF